MDGFRGSILESAYKGINKTFLFDNHFWKTVVGKLNMALICDKNILRF